MKNILRSSLPLTMVLSLSLGAASGLFAQTEDPKVLLGTWDIELTGMDMSLQLIFAKEEDVLTGVAEFEMGSGIMEEISLEEKKLTFLIGFDAGGQVLYVEVEAVVEEETMTGTMYSEMGDVGFTGKKRKQQSSTSATNSKPVLQAPPLPSRITWFRMGEIEELNAT